MRGTVVEPVVRAWALGAAATVAVVCAIVLTAPWDPHGSVFDADDEAVTATAVPSLAPADATPTDAAQDAQDATTPPPDGGFFVDPRTQAYAAWRAADGTDRDLLARIALVPQAHWVVTADAEAARAETDEYTGAAHRAGRTALLVVYGIPERDCGNWSAGGVEAEAYGEWVRSIAAGIIGDVWVVLEPDALAMIDRCGDREEREELLRTAARDLTDVGARVYVDAGSSHWLSAREAAARLAEVGVDEVAGFALNVSNYYPTSDAVEYGREVSALLGGTRFVVDTSRNGRGSDGQWCNPADRALGDAPRRVQDGTPVDALLWVKHPGQSDGECNGGPPAGGWWHAMALDLARNAAEG